MKASHFAPILGAAALVLVLTGCGDDKPTTNSATPTPKAAATPKPTPKETASATPKATPAATPKATPKPTPKAKPTPEPVYYANCTAVKAAGKAPIRRGDPGYSTDLDRDGDGIACET